MLHDSISRVSPLQSTKPPSSVRAHTLLLALAPPPHVLLHLVHCAQPVNSSGGGLFLPPAMTDILAHAYIIPQTNPETIHDTLGGYHHLYVYK